MLLGVLSLFLVCWSLVSLSVIILIYLLLFLAYDSKCKSDCNYCESFKRDRLCVGGEASQSLFISDFCIAVSPSLLRYLENLHDV